MVLNRSNKPLYLMPGEIIYGGQQDRTIGEEAIIPPGKKPAAIEVLCVEQGRWAAREDAETSEALDRLAERADNRMGTAAEAEDREAAEQSACTDYARAIDLLVHVVMNRWDARFPGIELIALEEVNRITPKAQAAGLSRIPLGSKLIKPLNADLRIVMTWDADNTSVNLKVTEPSAERASPGHRETTLGGIVSPGSPSGYGPERYMVRKAMKGIYRIEACDFFAGPNTLLAPVTVQVDVFTNYGRANEQHRSHTVRLQSVGDHFTVGEVKFNVQRKPSVSREEEQ